MHPEEHSSKRIRLNFNPCPGSSFLATLPAAGGGVFYPRHISSSRAHSNKIPTAIPMFSGSNILMLPLPVSRDVDICHRHKSKMEVANEMYTFYGCMADEGQIISNTQ